MELAFLVLLHTESHTLALCSITQKQQQWRQTKVANITLKSQFMYLLNNWSEFPCMRKCKLHEPITEFTAIAVRFSSHTEAAEKGAFMHEIIEWQIEWIFIWYENISHYVLVSRENELERIWKMVTGQSHIKTYLMLVYLNPH